MRKEDISFPLTYVIPGDPVTKKNSQNIYKNYKTGKFFITPSKRFSWYEQNASWSFHGSDMELKIDFPVNIKCIYYMETRRKVDLTNLLEATDDILTTYGILADDNMRIIAGHDGSRVKYAGKIGNPRVEITIEPLDFQFEDS